MLTKMKNAWGRWHKDVPEDDRPNVNPSFHAGFEAAHDLLMPLLEKAAPHVYASAGANHMLDGFKPRRRPIDELVEQIKAVISD